MTRIPTFLTISAGVILGFGIAVFSCLSLGRSNVKSVSPPAENPTTVTATPALESSDLQGSLAGFEELPALGRLKIAARSRDLDIDSRMQLLDDVMDLPVDDRRSILAVLVLQWVALDPIAANIWCRENLSGEERVRILADVMKTWAREDAMAVARWWAKEMPIDDISNVGMEAGFKALWENDPIAYATYMDIPPLKGSFWLSNFLREDILQDSAEVDRLATAVVGNIGYTDDTDPLSSHRSAEGKCGWNELFEAVAMEKYQHDPSLEFESWLGEFSENAQKVIRERIKRREQQAARELAAADPSRTEKATPALVRDDPSSVPSAENFSRAQKKWAEWYSSDRPAAEAFLEASAWPSELKLRARADAYNQRPESLKKAFLFRMTRR